MYTDRLPEDSHYQNLVPGDLASVNLPASLFAFRGIHVIGHAPSSSLLAVGDEHTNGTRSARMIEAMACRKHSCLSLTRGIDFSGAGDSPDVDP